MRSRPARPRASRHAAPASKRRPLRLVALYFTPCELLDMRFDVSARILESVLPLPKHHSQSAQDLVKKTTLNPGTGGSNEKAISRKRSARRVGLGDAGGIRCRTASAGIYAAAAGPSGLHLVRLLHRRRWGLWIGAEHPFYNCGIRCYHEQHRVRHPASSRF